MDIPNVSIDNDEVEYDQEKIRQIIEYYSLQTLKATQRMIDYCTDSENAGIRTLMHLEEQGEKLDRANQRLHTVGSDLDLVDKNLNNLDVGCCGCKIKVRSLFACCIGLKKNICTCNRNLKLEVSSERNSVAKKISQIQSTSSSKNLLTSAVQLRSSSGTVINPANLNQVVNLDTLTEERIAQNLEHLAYSLTTMRSLAQNVNNELDTQNKKIQKIGHHANLTVNQVHDADKIGKRIVSSN